MRRPLFVFVIAVLLMLSARMAGAVPQKVTREMTAVYGVGAFLMAATEIMELIE